MSSVDERIVQMELENKKFEKNAEETLNTLEKLDEALQFKNAQDGLENVEKASRKLDFRNLSDSVQDISSKFSGWGIAAASAIATITSKVTGDLLGSLGKVKSQIDSLTTAQVGAGFQKYNDSVANQVALYNQLKYTTPDITYEKIAEYIDELGWYADATSFDIASMTSALTKFVAQGIDVEKAIPAIMGIGNSITYAGKDAKAGSYAFETYAKSIGSGFMQLIQEKSLSNMGIITAQLKQQFIDAAVAAGTLKKKSKDLYKTTKKAKKSGVNVSLSEFDYTLAQGWLTDDVILDVMGDTYGRYTDSLYKFAKAHEEATGEVWTLDQAMSAFGKNDAFGAEVLLKAGVAKTFTEAIDSIKDAASSQWSTIFSKIFGNPEESMELWTNVANKLFDIFVTPVSKVRSLFEDWYDLGGRTDLIVYFHELERSIHSLIDPLLEAVKAFFPEASAKTIDKLASLVLKLAVKIRNLANALNKNNGAANALTTLLNLFKMGMNLLKRFKTSMEPVRKAIQNLFDPITKTTNGINGFINKIADAVNEGTLIGTVFDFIGNSLANIINFISKAISKISGIFSLDIFEKILPWITSFFTRSWGVISNILGAIGQVFSAIGNVILNFLDAIIPKTEEISDDIGGLQEVSEPFVSTVLKELANWITTHSAEIVDFMVAAAKTIKKLAVTIKNFIKNSLSKISGWFDKNWPTIKSALGFIPNKLSELWKSFNGSKDANNSTEQTSNNVSALSVAIETFGDVADKVKEKIGGLFGLFGQKIGGTEFSFGETLLAILVAVKIVKNIKKTIRGVNVVKSVTSFVDQCSGLVKSIKEKIAPSTKSNKLFNNIKAIGTTVLMVGLAALAVAKAVEMISTVNYDEHKKEIWALFGFIGVLLAVVTLMAIMITKLQKKSVSVTIAIRGVLFMFAGLSLAVLAIAKAMTMIASIEKFDPNALYTFRDILYVLMLATVVMVAIAGYFGGSAALKGVGMVFAGIALMVYAVGKTIAALNDIRITSDSDAAFEAFTGLLWSILGAVALMVLFSALSKDGAASLRGVAAVVIALSISMFAIIGVLKLIDKATFDPEAMKDRLYAFGGIFAALALAVAIIAKSARRKSMGPLLAASVMVGALVIAMYAIIGVLKLLETVDLTGHWKEFAALAGIFAILALTTTLIVKKMRKGTAGGIFAASTVIFAFSIAALAVAGALSIVSNIDLNGGTTALWFFTGIIGALLVAITLMSIFGKGSFGTLAGAALVLLVFGMTVEMVAISIATVSLIPSNASGALDSFAKIIGLLLVAVTLMSIFGKGSFGTLAGAALVLIAFGLVADILAGVAIKMGIIPYQTMLNGISSLIQICAVLVVMLIALAVLGNYAGPIALAELVCLGLAAIIVIFASIAQTLGEMDITALSDGLAKMIVLMVTIELILAALSAIGLLAGPIALAELVITGLLAIILLLVACVDAINGADFGAAFDNVAGALSGMVQSVIEFAGNIIERVKELIANIIEKVAEFVKNVVGKIVDFFTNLWSKITTFVGNVWEKIKTFFVNIWDKITTFVTNTKNNIATFVSNIWEKVTGFLGNIWDKVKTFFGNIWDKIKGFFADTVQHFKDKKEELKTKAKEIIDGIKEKFNFSEIFGKVKQFFIDTFQHFKDKVQEAKDRAKDIIDGIKEMFDFSAIIEKVKGFFTNSEGTGILDIFKKKNKDMESSGENLMEGVKTGITNKSNDSKFVNGIKGVANKISGLFNNVFKIASPSKLFAEKGMYLMLGLAQGISDYAKDAEKESLNAAKGVSNSLVLDTIGLDPNPKITPVLDLSEIQNRKSVLENLLNGKSVSVSGNIGSSIVSQGAIEAKLSTDISSLKSELSKLNTKQISENGLASALKTALADTDVYIDGTKAGRLITRYQANYKRSAGV